MPHSSGLEDLVVVAGAPIGGHHPVGLRAGFCPGPLAGPGRPEPTAVAFFFAAAMPRDGSRPIRRPASSSVHSTMLLLPKPVHDQMVAHCLTGLPDEAAGCWAATSETGEVVTCYPTRNLAASAKLYTVDPKDHLRADRDAEAAGVLDHRGLPLPYPYRGLPVARPTSPRPPTRPGTTCWSRSGTSSRWSGATGSWTGRSPRSRSGCSPGRIPTELVNFCRRRAVESNRNPIQSQRRPRARPSQPADRPAVPRRRRQDRLRRGVHRGRGPDGPGRPVPGPVGPGHQRRRDRCTSS